MAASFSYGRGSAGQGSQGGSRCQYCKRMRHHSEKCYDKFGKPQWTNTTTTEASPVPDTTTSTTDQTVTISQADYTRFLQLQATDSSTTAAHASHSGTSSALIASKDNSWIIDSEASSQMSSTSNIFTRLTLHTSPL